MSRLRRSTATVDHDDDDDDDDNGDEDNDQENDDGTDDDISAWSSFSLTAVRMRCIFAAKTTANILRRRGDYGVMTASAIVESTRR